MNCDELRDQYELYALGALDPEERAELEAHLRRDGDPCVDGVRRARQTMTSLALMTPESHPPSRLRKRVIALTGEPQRSWSGTPVWILATAVLAVVAVWLGIQRRDQARALAELRLGAQR